ncbi:immunoglobulin-like domain-containing protein, partial [Clostridium sp.]|uniref:immunoglobulin-like domain-containing protein n=1 Tax=Clostridium sp. TaxID=1506 RepID=UPI003BAFBB29
GEVASAEVTVKSNDVAPIINGVQDKEIKAGDVAKFNAGENLDGITGQDSEGNTLTVTVEGQVEIPDAGTNKEFEIKYLVKDKNGYETVEIRKVTVTNQLPVISGLNAMAVTEGENIDLKSGITVHDFEDGDITNNLVCLTDLNTLTVGENIVQYSVSDADGNIVTGERKVIVLEKEEQKPEEKPEIPSEPEVPSEPEKPSEPGNGVIVNPETNNGTADKNENSSSNNSNNSGNNSIEVNKADVPNTYDGGIGSYILSGIGSLGLLSILNRRKRRK